MKRTARLTRKTPLRPSRKPIPKQGNTKRRKAREKRTRDLHKTPEYLAVRDEAMERAGDRCEFTQTYERDHPFGSGVRVTVTQRCPIVDTEEEPLHCHLESYGAVGKLKAKRAKMYCYQHHMLVESQLRPQNVNRLGRKAV